MIEEMERDWADDETMSAEETLRRFEALHPEPAVGPQMGQHIFVPVTPPDSEDDD